jgi:H+/Na+-translocating ferredoxin:NAD+ oxidoreductase subunit G
MRDMLRLFAVVTLFAAVSGGLLAGVRAGTKERIETQQIKFVKGPAIHEIMKGCSNDPLTTRFKLKDGREERTFFVGVFHGKPNTVAFEATGKGYGGSLDIMVAVDVDDDRIVGVGVTTNRETPGVGARVKTDPRFVNQFKGQSIQEPFKLKAEGGKIDAISGATTSSRGLVGAVVSSGEIYQRLKPDILEKIRSIKS